MCPAGRFTGKERDAETGLDYFGARYFSAAQGRFTSPDWSEKPQPVPYADLADPQTLNLYSYVRNNPLSRADPDGHCGLDDPAGCTFKQWVASIPDRIVGGLKGEANAVLDMVRGGDRVGRFQPSNAEQADAMQAVKQVEPEFQQGLAIVIPGPEGDVPTASTMRGAQRMGMREEGHTNISTARLSTEHSRWKAVHV